MASLGNLLVIHALWKASSIPVQTKKLLLSLAFSDLLVGLYIQPMFGVIIVVTLNMLANGNCNFRHLCPSVIITAVFSTYVIVGGSFFTIVVIALNRFFAVSLHLRYHELVPEKRVCMGIVILWLTSGLASITLIALPSHNDIVAITVQTVGL